MLHRFSLAFRVRGGASKLLGFGRRVLKLWDQGLRVWDGLRFAVGSLLSPISDTGLRDVKRSRDSSKVQVPKLLKTHG